MSNLYDLCWSFILKIAATNKYQGKTIYKWFCNRGYLSVQKGIIFIISNEEKVIYEIKYYNGRKLIWNVAINKKSVK